MKKQKTKEHALQKYVDSLDLRTMWEKFFGEHKSNGTLKYPTAWSFVITQTKNEKQRDVLQWMIGPKVEIQHGQRGKYPFEQFDWEEKREKGFWYSSSNINALKTDVKRCHNALDKIQEAGSVNLDMLAKLKQLSNQVDKEFGQLFLPDLTAKENSIRVKLYFSLTKEIVELMNSVQFMYAKTQGMDLQKLDQFIQMFASGMGSKMAEQLGYKTNSAENDKSTYHTVLNSISDMMLRKSADLDMTLPDSDVEEIVLSKSKPELVLKRKPN